MTPPMNEDGSAYVVNDLLRSDQPRPSDAWLEFEPLPHGAVRVTVHDAGRTAWLHVDPHTLVRAAVAAALDAFEDLHSPRADGAGEHDPSRTEQFRTDREQEN